MRRDRAYRERLLEQAQSRRFLQDAPIQQARRLCGCSQLTAACGKLTPPTIFVSVPDHVWKRGDLPVADQTGPTPGRVAAGEQKPVGDPNRELDQVMNINHHIRGVLCGAAAVLSGSTGYGQFLPNNYCQQPESTGTVAVVDYNPATGEEYAPLELPSPVANETTTYAPMQPGGYSPYGMEESSMLIDEGPLRLETCNCGGRCERCSPRPRWTATAESVWFERSGADRHPLSFNGSNLPDIMSTRDLDYGTANGYRLTLTKALASLSNTSFELSYLGIDDWDDQSQVVDPGNLDSFLRAGFPNSDQFRNAYSQTVFAETSLDSVEVGARRYWATKKGSIASVMAGFRYIHIADDLLFLSNDSDPAVSADDIGRYTVRTKNDLVGGQIGGTLASQCTSKFSAGAKLKTGIFANFNEQNGHLLNVPAPQAPTTDLYSRASGTSLSAMVETGLFANYRFSSCMGVRAGYDVFIIDGLALTANQLDYTANQFQGQPFINNTSSLVFYGPTLGLWVNW